MEISGESLPGEEGEGGLEEGGEEPWGREGGEGEAIDSTFYYILFTLSVLAAALGQFLVNHELQGREGQGILN